MAKVFAIITTYNGLKWYDKCLGSLQKSSLPIHVIAIDNSSVDNSINYIREYYPEVTLLKSDENIGFGQANNKGIRYALDHGADYVFLLNQDAWLETDTIEKLINIQKKHTEYGILSPFHLNGTGEKLDAGFLNYAGPQYTSGLLNDLCLNKVSDVYKSKFVNAAAWLISRECLEKVGGFDPIFFHYGEDFNYCQRIQYHGMKIGIVPSTQIYHDRDHKPEAYGSKQILRHYLLTVADINNSNFRKDHKRLRQQDVIRMITGILRFDWKRLRGNWHNLKLKRKYFPQILQSRKINREGGPAYLS